MSQETAQVTEPKIEELTGLNTAPEDLLPLNEEPRSESDSESGSEDGNDEIDYNSADIHDEVECLLSGDQMDILQLIATDPEYYLGIVQNYNKMRDGHEIYLSDLFNILVSRTGGKLNIKFKLSDNTQWYDVGFTGGTFDDKAVYKAFSDKVDSLMKNPPPSRREFLNDTMRPEVKEAPPMVNQGNQYKLSKIDRFLGRTEHATEGPPSVRVEETCSVSEPSPRPTVIGSGSGSERAPPVRGNDDMINNVVKSYKEQLKARLQELPHGTSVPDNGHLPSPSQCPESKRRDYLKLLYLVNNNSPFVKGLVESLPASTPGQRFLVTDFLYGVESPLSEEELIRKLKLSDTDRQLLQTYNIRLSEL